MLAASCFAICHLLAAGCEHGWKKRLPITGHVDQVRHLHVFLEYGKHLKAHDRQTLTGWNKQHGIVAAATAESELRFHLQPDRKRSRLQWRPCVRCNTYGMCFSAPARLDVQSLENIPVLIPHRCQILTR